MNILEKIEKPCSIIDGINRKKDITNHSQISKIKIFAIMTLSSPSLNVFCFRKQMYSEK